MDAREYLDWLKDNQEILTLALYSGKVCVGRAAALIIEPEYQIAVMLEDCGNPEETDIRAGNLVKYVLHPEGEPKIVGSPARICP